VIEASDVREDMLVLVGLGIERAARVISLVRPKNGRPFVRVRLYRSDSINDYPLSVVRAMTAEEAEPYEPKPRKRQAKTWREREAKKASVPVPPSRAVPVTIFDIGKAAGLGEQAVRTALRKHGLGGGE
jgi:hypothetical protein